MLFAELDSGSVGYFLSERDRVWILKNWLLGSQQLKNYCLVPTSEKIRKYCGSCCSGDYPLTYPWLFRSMHRKMKRKQDSIISWMSVFAPGGSGATVRYTLSKFANQTYSDVFIRWGSPIISCCLDVKIRIVGRIYAPARREGHSHSDEWRASVV